MWQLLALLVLERLASHRPDVAVVESGPVGEQVFYRTKDGAADYAFSIERQSNGAYRIYIAAQPSYGSRSSQPAATHRLIDAAGRPYICWSRSIENHSQARQVSALWADATQRYISTGRHF